MVACSRMMALKSCLGFQRPLYEDGVIRYLRGDVIMRISHLICFATFKQNGRGPQGEGKAALIYHIADY